MSLSYDIDVTSRVVVITCGNTSLERWRDMMMRIFADPRYQPGFSVIVDCRTATLTPSTEDVRGVVSFISSHRAMLGRAQWAVVVERPSGYGMARMAEAIAQISDINLRAFQKPDEALAWFAGTEALERE
jgi:hypothetical protein